jgi:hypothetical protein
MKLESLLKLLEEEQRKSLSEQIDAWGNEEGPLDDDMPDEEQEDNPDEEPQDNLDLEPDVNDDGVRDDNVVRDEELANDNDEPLPAEIANRPTGQQKDKSGNVRNQAKRKWLQERPDLSNDEMNITINSFQRVKDTLRPYVEADNTTQVGRRNMPAVVALRSMTDFPVTDVTKLRDFLAYTWAEITYLLDRIGQVDINADNLDNFTGEFFRELDDDLKRNKLNERFHEIAVKKWRPDMLRQAGSTIKIIAEPSIVDGEYEQGVVVVCTKSRDACVNLGLLQSHLREKYHRYADWCIAVPPWSTSGTYYFRYRNETSIYMIRDTRRPETDIYHISVIRVWSNGMMELTSASNGDGRRVNWDTIVELYPSLANKRSLFVNEAPRPEELDGSWADRITFTNDKFLLLTKAGVSKYILLGKKIQAMYAFESLTEQQLNDYIRLTSVNDYLTRFYLENAPNPFAMIDYLKNYYKEGYKFLDTTVLKTQLGITKGVGSIRLTNMMNGIEQVLSEVTKVDRAGNQIPGRDVTLICDKNTGLLQIINLETFEPIFEGKTYDRIYTPVKSTLFKRRKGSNEWEVTSDEEKRKPNSDYIYRFLTKYGISKNHMEMFRREQERGIPREPYFYYLISPRAYSSNASSDIRFKGEFKTAEEGDAFLQNVRS